MLGTPQNHLQTGNQIHLQTRHICLQEPACSHGSEKSYLRDVQHGGCEFGVQARIQAITVAVLQEHLHRLLQGHDRMLVKSVIFH